MGESFHHENKGKRSIPLFMKKETLPPKDEIMGGKQEEGKKEGCSLTLLRDVG